MDKPEDVSKLMSNLSLRNNLDQVHTQYQYQFGCGILKIVGPKKQYFWPKINVLKGNHCIFRIWGAPIRQKLRMLLENKVVQKL